MEKNCLNCKHYNKLRYMRRGCFMDSDYEICLKSFAIQRNLTPCADFQPAGKRYAAESCVAEVADNIKAAVGRLDAIMEDLFLTDRPSASLKTPPDGNPSVSAESTSNGNPSASPETQSSGNPSASAETQVNGNPSASLKTPPNGNPSASAETQSSGNPSASAKIPPDGNPSASLKTPSSVNPSDNSCSS